MYGQVAIGSRHGAADQQSPSADSSETCRQPLGRCRSVSGQTWLAIGVSAGDTGAAPIEVRESSRTRITLKMAAVGDFATTPASGVGTVGRLGGLTRIIPVNLVDHALEAARGLHKWVRRSPSRGGVRAPRERVVHLDGLVPGLGAAECLRRRWVRGRCRSGRATRCRRCGGRRASGCRRAVARRA